MNGCMQEAVNECVHDAVCACMHVFLRSCACMHTVVCLPVSILDMCSWPNKIAPCLALRSYYTAGGRRGDRAKALACCAGWRRAALKWHYPKRRDAEEEEQYWLHGVQRLRGCRENYFRVRIF